MVKLKKCTRVIIVLAIALVFALLIAPVREGSGDFGGFAGNSDYSRNSSHSSSHSSSNSWSGSSNSNGGGLALGTAVGTMVGTVLLGGDDDFSFADEDCGFEDIIIILFIGFILFQAFRTAKGSGSKKRRGVNVNIPQVGPKMNLRPMSHYQSLDPNFDEAQLRAWVAKVYVQLQEAWQGKDIEPVRAFLSDAIFNQMNTGLDSLRKKHCTNYIDDIAVLGVDFRGFTQKGGLDCIIARVTTRITDYTLDDNTGKLVSGDRKREKFMEYEWTLVRKSGVTTRKVKDGGVQVATCPHCGAPVDRSASMKCPYCGSVLTAMSEEWVISNMQGISQRTK